MDSPMSPQTKLGRTPVRADTQAFGISGPKRGSKEERDAKTTFSSMNAVETKNLRDLFVPSSLNVASAKLRNRLIKNPRGIELYPTPI
jgi:hypothetical protein